MNNQYLSRYNAGDTQFARTDSLNGHWPDDEGSMIFKVAAGMGFIFTLVAISLWALSHV